MIPAPNASPDTSGEAMKPAPTDRIAPMIHQTSPGRSIIHVSRGL